MTDAFKSMGYVLVSHTGNHYELRSAADGASTLMIDGTTDHLTDAMLSVSNNPDGHAAVRTFFDLTDSTDPGVFSGLGWVMETASGRGVVAGLQGKYHYNIIAGANNLGVIVTF